MRTIDKAATALKDYLDDKPLRRNIRIIVVALVVVVAGTWFAVKATTDYLLYRTATDMANGWAQTLAKNVPDIAQIANGEAPSSESMAFFDWARKTGSVFRYVIYNTAGYSQLVSEKAVTPVDVSDFSPEALRAIETGKPVTDAIEGSTPDRPAYYSRAFVPVVVDGKPVAAISAFVDQTEARSVVLKTLFTAGSGLSLLVALAFGAPAIAWYRRSKENQIADRRIHFLAHHDALTGLTNRSRLMERLDNAIVARVSEGNGLALHFIDLDKFKEINDTLGHDGGDFLLKSIAERLKAATRMGDFVARLGGDEFVVVQDSVTDKQEAGHFAERLLNTLRAPLQFEGFELRPEASLGIAMVPTDGTTSERLLKCADLALYASKAAGRNRFHFFLPEMDAELRARLKLERQVREATQKQGFVLHFQPLFETQGQHLTGFEALIRLPQDDGTLIEPLTLIPVAEDLHLIGEIGAWVIRSACRAAVSWPEELTVAVNLSPAQFEESKVVDIVRSALDETGLAPDRLEIEVTERLLLRDSDEVMRELRALKAMGVSVVMDDFGTGYSSLSYLWRFPFDKIKIDRSFMSAFDDATGDSETVVRTIIGLSRQLHMAVTVEGVETAKQVAFLEGAAADQMQGFYFDKPMPASDVAACILKNFRQPAEAEPAKKAPKAARLTS